MSDFQAPFQGLDRKAFQKRVLDSMPEHLRQDMQQLFDAYDSMPDDQKIALREEEERRQALESARSIALDLRKNVGLAGDQWSNTFRNYVPMGTPTERASQKEAYLVAKRFAAAFPDVTKGIMFHGLPGRGKDHLLHAIVLGILEKKQTYRIRYAYSLDLEQEWMREWSWHNDDDTALEESLRSADLVLIGDINKLFNIEPAGVYTKRIERAMWRLVNQSESTGKPIICATSNYGPAQWTKAVDESLTSRLQDCMKWCEVLGPDRRLNES